jgi:uncharacterized protein YijF (DUF1287 family)
MMELEGRQPSIPHRPGFFVRLLRFFRKLIVLVLLLVLIFAAFESTFFWEFSAKLFHGIDTVHSQYDVDNDGIDDFTDIMLAARRYIRTKPTYDASWSNGYPPADRGVCTDVIWYALGSAGYDFKALIDQDIRQNPNLYPDRANGSSKIDFRRVANLRVFFERHTQKLTTDVMQVEQWQPGDIVFYAPSHVAIVSDRRNLLGQPWIIHLTSDGAMEEDNLDYSRIKDGSVVLTAHYRWILKEATKKTAASENRMRQFLHIGRFYFR